MASTRLTREEMEAELSALRADNQHLTNSLCALKVAFYNGYYRSNGVMVCFDIPTLERFYFDGHEGNLHFSEVERQRVLSACKDILFDPLGFPVAVYYKKSLHDEVKKFDVRLDPQNTTVRDVYKALVKLSPKTFPALVDDNAILPAFFNIIHGSIANLEPEGNEYYAREGDRSVYCEDPLQVWFPSQEDESDEDEDEDERPDILRCFFNFVGFGYNEAVEWLIGSNKTVYEVKEHLTFRIVNLTAEDIYLVYDDVILNTNYIFGDVVPDEATVAVYLHTAEDEDETDEAEYKETVRERLEHLIRVTDENNELPDGWDAQVTEYVDLFAPTPDTPWDAEDIPENELELLAEDYFKWMGYDSEQEMRPYLFKWIGRDTDTYVEVEIHRAQNVYEVKYYITEEEPNLNAEDIRLVYRDNILEDDEANFFDIVPRGASVQVFINGRGGGDKKRKLEEKLEDYKEKIQKQQQKVLPENNQYAKDVLPIVDFYTNGSGTSIQTRVNMLNSVESNALSDAYWNEEKGQVDRIVKSIGKHLVPQIKWLEDVRNQSDEARKLLILAVESAYVAEISDGRRADNSIFEGILESHISELENEAEIQRRVEQFTQSQTATAMDDDL
ncbi:hypothetical protein AK812_SmicGene30352 [Symbiodinium microadriaticum]|uniref:Ubiquitin-like domain-containing protein n=1 Tax=Symbiodinium microadriaticum TaxID=2951 RepID=A0A1Q9CZI8_SYMMI|nr:hypothetical protein AK812_SmicGene30352 [Symbiodinium microadriaticum]